MSDELRALFDNELGASGEYPLGKLTPNDEGELKMAVGCEKGKVILAFGKDVTWIGFTPEQARDLAEQFCKNAASIDGITTHVRRSHSE